MPSYGQHKGLMPSNVLQIITSQPLPVELGVKSELRIPEKRILWFIRPYRMIVMKLSEKSCFLKCHDVFLS